MSGKGKVRFSDLFRDTYRTLGAFATFQHYVVKHHMPE